MNTFIKDFGPTVYTVRRMLEMQEDLKLKKDFKVKAVSIVESRFPLHWEMFVEVDNGKQYVQLLEQQGREGQIFPCSSFVEVVRVGGTR